MWYLIVPPLVFLASLWLLLFFLSRRAADPRLQEGLAHLGGEAPRRFLFLKEETGLRILEKLTQRFKVSTLKMHNMFHELSQALRKRREQSEIRKKEREARRAELQAAGSQSPRWSPFRSDGKGNKAESTLPHVEKTVSVSTATPAQASEKESLFSFRSLRGLRGNHQEPHVSAPVLPAEDLPVLRRHEPLPQKPKRLVSEEELIERIAKNPKDAVSYEELGDYYMETKNLDDAKACYRQVIKLSPFNRGVKDKVRKLERLLTQKAR